jgi:hypothetical protein
MLHHTSLEIFTPTLYVTSLTEGHFFLLHGRRKIRFIEGNAKCRYRKIYLLIKGICGR